MRLLVINYAMSETAVTLAWQARVVRELAGQCEHVAVLTDEIGQYSVPDNVTVEKFARPAFPPILATRISALLQTWRFCRQQRVQAVFLHMAHLHAFTLYPVFRALNLPVLLWYAHGAVTWHLRLAHACVNRVISSTPEGFRIPSPKAHFIGQGVDTDLFKLPKTAGKPKQDLISVCRISRSKRLDLLCSIMEQLRADGLRLKIIGIPLTADDRAYDVELRNRIDREKLPIDLVGFVPLDAIPPFYDDAWLHLNVSQTNSMDKAPLEALACGCPILTSNPAFRDILADYPEFVIRDETPTAIANQVRRIFSRRSEFAPVKLRALVLNHHDLHSYTGRIMEQLTALTAA